MGVTNNQPASIKYIENARSFKGWEKTVRIALSKCEDIETWEAIVQACYNKHDFFVYELGIVYGLAPSRYGNLLDTIRYLTRNWYEEYHAKNNLEIPKVAIDWECYGFVTY